MTLEGATISPSRLAVAFGIAAGAVLLGVLASAGSSGGPPAPSAASVAAEPATVAPATGSPARPSDAAALAAGAPDIDLPVLDAPGGPAVDAPASDPPGAAAPGTAPIDPEAAQAAAYQVAADFAAAYGRHHFDDGPSATSDRVRPFVTAELARDLAGGSGAVAAREERAARREQASATVQAVQLQGGSVEEGRLDLLVVVRQEISSAGGSQTAWPTLLVQVSVVDGIWLVSRLLP